MSRDQTPDALLPSTFKAWRFHTTARNMEKVMCLEHIPRPASFNSLPADSTVIKVLYACLNPVDIKFGETPLFGRFVQPLPAIPGCDGVGRVVKTTDPTRHVGELVTFRIVENQAEGSLTEYVMVPRSGSASIPENVSLIQAATVGTCGVTAYQTIAPFMPAGLEKPQAPGGPQLKVFINGGSGGTGTFEIQIAKAMGCYVVTSCSTRNVELCRKMGADEVIDYQLDDVDKALSQMVQRDGKQPFDLVVDNIDRPWRLYKAADAYLQPGGTYLQIGGDVTLGSVGELAWIKLVPAMLGGGKRRWAFMAMKTSRDDAERVLAWMAQGKVKIPIDQEFAFEDVPRAYEKLKAGRTRGKIVVRVSEDVST